MLEQERMFLCGELLKNGTGNALCESAALAGEERESGKSSGVYFAGNKKNHVFERR